MSIRLMSEIFESETLGPTQRLIMLALADHADDEGRCYPSIARLCQRTGLSERAVRNNLRKLEEQGYLHTEKGVGRGGTSLYSVSANPSPDVVKGAGDAPFDGPEKGQEVPPAANAPRQQVPKKGHLVPKKGQEVPPNHQEPSLTIGGGGSACARDASPDPPRITTADLEGSPTLRERILAACGADPVSGLTGPSGSVLGTRADMHAVERWRDDLGLDDETILAVIIDAMSRKRDGPPSRLTYFDRPMQREAGLRNRPKLEADNATFPVPASGSPHRPASAGSGGFPSGLVGVAMRRAAARRAEDARKI